MIPHLSGEPREGKDALQQVQSVPRPRIERVIFLIDVSIITGRASLLGPNSRLCVSVQKMWVVLPEAGCKYVYTSVRLSETFTCSENQPKGSRQNTLQIISFNASQLL
jgi:hypothetical protein